ncbi:hypothetical protein F5Y03DRAFT_382704 [Xylaria venustula]|nr:hypothetical protein F5Y03DRAFT_382704 [Xylaria venustula]
MDAVEQLFALLPRPDGGPSDDDLTAALRFTNALENFVKGPVSEDPDYKYLLAHAQKSLTPGCATVAYIRQQLAYLAVQKSVSRKDKSQKARQLKYYRWFANGMKTEAYPFEERKPQGHASTTRIASLTSTTICAYCGKNGANLRCPDCALTDEYHILSKTSYCNKECLKTHREAHRSVCDGRRMVFRAASLLDHIFMAIEDATYVYPMGKLFKKNGIFYLTDNEWDRASMTGRHVFIPFPKHMVESMDDHRSLLLWGQAEEVTLCLFPLIIYLFKPFCKNMELASVQPKNVITTVCQMSLGRALNINLFKHTCLKLTLKSDEQYVIDLTGAQFGWKETLAPWTVWADLRAASTESEAFRSASKRVVETLQQGVLEVQQQEIRTMVMKAILKDLDTVLHSHSDHRSFDKLLRSSDEDYKRVEDNIKAMVRHQIYTLITIGCHKDSYRIWTSGHNGVQIAKERVKTLKKIWFTGREYDKLRSKGADMRKLWTERFEANYKRTHGTTGGAGPSHVHEAPKKS